MTNLERDPALVATDAATERPVGGAEVGGAPSTPRGAIEVLSPREVPLGGPRAMTVRRTLPQRRRSLIGAWCFVDHYGPDDVSTSGGMHVPGHPHTGLQTVTWLFEGEIEHRDTLGTLLTIRPGEVNLMTSGEGIAHSEYSTPTTTRVHGAQLWIALPEPRRQGSRAFEHFAPEPFAVDDAVVKVFLGRLAGASSPVRTWTRVVGAEIRLPAHGRVALDVDPAFEHGVLVDTGTITLEGEPGDGSELLFSAVGASRLTLVAGADGARVLLIGGEPLGESIVMWWNFIARDHDEIVAQRTAWQDRVSALRDGGTPGDAERFGEFPDAWNDVLPAPELPNVRLSPRR
ncbi:pirin family protein [Amnibacterium flavum]|uniref:Pirin n=1 Tax=Amnibacterium flavum TaxID=2173173 RepID=A0A2V1HW12_9MICO|nr:pirin family protein [Amnibacterium flavum]PVZ94607.1 pirin [Amnibacterium flavum]